MNILVTGGANGLGRAITQTLAGAGHRVFFTFYQSAEKARILETEQSNVKAIHCDFRNGESIEQLISVMPSFDLDCLINNATTSPEIKHFHKMADEGFIESFQANLIPVIQITKAAIKIFRKKKFGKIINILSSAIINKPPVGWAAYTAEKAYLQSLSKSWATENARFNITSNSISPAFMKTDFTQRIDERLIETMEKNHPLGKILEPEIVAESVLSLVQASQFINGTNVVINAGENLIN